MKSLFFLVVSGMYYWYSCGYPGDRSQSQSEFKGDTVVVKKDTARAIEFVADIQPILQKRCSPCHFTGGKMYEKLPFDKAETILTHQPGVLKRIKKEPDAQKIKDFFAQNPR